MKITTYNKNKKNRLFPGQIDTAIRAFQHRLDAAKETVWVFRFLDDSEEVIYRKTQNRLSRQVGRIYTHTFSPPTVITIGEMVGNAAADAPGEIRRGFSYISGILYIYIIMYVYCHTNNKKKN